MDTLTFLVGMTKALAWPALVAWVVWLLQTPLREVVSRLGRRKMLMKAGGAEFSMSEELDKVEQVAQVMPPEVKEPTLALDQAPPEPMQSKAAAMIAEAARGASLMEAPPAYIVNQAWTQMLAALKAAVQKKVPEAPSEKQDARRIIELALKTGIINNEEYIQLNELRRIRNVAVHEGDAAVTMTDALRFTNVLIESIAKFSHFL